MSSRDTCRRCRTDPRHGRRTRPGIELLEWRCVLANINMLDGISPNGDSFLSTFLHEVERFSDSVPEFGWVWVDPNQKYVSITGQVKDSYVSHTDFPAVHDSHDFEAEVEVDGLDLLLMPWGDGSRVPTSGNKLAIVGADNNGALNFRIFDGDGIRVTNTDETKLPTQAGAISALKQRLTHSLSDAEKAQIITDVTSIVGQNQLDGGYDPESGRSYNKLLSIINPSGIMAVEWETGTHVDELSGDGAHPLFPRWAWPSPGDRVWVEGAWIYDTGHPEERSLVERYASEIHPPRAFASMRDKIKPMPGTGNVPVRVTETDLFIHGDGGYAMEVLTGGLGKVYDGFGDSVRTSPIDKDFDFYIRLPDKPADTAVLTMNYKDAPGNTVHIDPILTPDLAHNRVHVVIPLANTGTTPEDVYAREINVGWAYPVPGLRHLTLTLNKMDLHQDMEVAGQDGELTFFYLNVGNTNNPTEWYRMVDYHSGGEDMSDYDDDNGLGNGESYFSGPTFDIYVDEDDHIGIHANGYDQDAIDDQDTILPNLFGNHHAWILQIPLYLAMYAESLAFHYELPTNDMYNPLDVDIAPPFQLGELTRPNPENQYDLFFTLGEVPLRPDEVNEAPIAVVGGPKTVAEGGSVVLSSAGSHDPDGLITAYQWDFSYDGTFQVDATGASPTFSAATLDGPSTRTIALRVIDNLGVPTIALTFLTVKNVAPTATLTNGGPVDEGSIGLVRLTDPFDPSPADTAAGFRYSYDFDNDGAFEITDSPSASAVVPASYLAVGPGIGTIRALIKDKDGDSTPYTTAILIISVPPTVNVGPDATITQGDSLSRTGSFSDPGADTWTATVDYGDGLGSQPLALNADKTFRLNHTYASAGTFPVTVVVMDGNGNGSVGLNSFMVVVAPLPVAPPPPVPQPRPASTPMVGPVPITTFAGQFPQPMVGPVPMTSSTGQFPQVQVRNDVAKAGRRPLSVNRTVNLKRVNLLSPSREAAGSQRLAVAQRHPAGPHVYKLTNSGRPRSRPL